MLPYFSLHNIPMNSFYFIVDERATKKKKSEKAHEKTVHEIEIWSLVLGCLHSNTSSVAY